jgi:hypothetical protein
MRHTNPNGGGLTRKGTGNNELCLSADEVRRKLSPSTVQVVVVRLLDPSTVQVVVVRLLLSAHTFSCCAAVVEKVYGWRS